MTAAILLTAVMISAEPNVEQTELLKLFHSEFVHVTPGKGKFPKSFKMGSAAGSPAEQPVRTVTFDYDFHVAKYEVPQNLWTAVLGSNPSRWTGKRNSVEMLTFDEAEQFCQKATRLMRAAKLIGDKQEIRLPTEAEWEYFARAGTTTKYSFGDEVDQLTDYGWFTGNASGNDPPVGAKKPNAWGLYDIHGYLWEWCADHAHQSLEGGPTDGSAWVKGGDAKRRVIRGGSWKDKAELLTSSCRQGSFRGLKREVTIEIKGGGIYKEIKDDALGLRCVLGDVKND